MRGIADAPPATVPTVADTRRPLTACEQQTVRRAAAAGWFTRSRSPRPEDWRAALASVNVDDPVLAQTFTGLLDDAASADDERLSRAMCLGAARWLFDRLDYDQAAEAHRALTWGLCAVGVSDPEMMRRAAPAGAGFGFDGVWLSL